MLRSRVKFNKLSVFVPNIQHMLKIIENYGTINIIPVDYKKENIFKTSKFEIIISRILSV